VVEVVEAEDVVVVVEVVPKFNVGVVVVVVVVEEVVVLAVLVVVVVVFFTNENEVPRD
jgi:hypothetical protein